MWTSSCFQSDFIAQGLQNERLAGWFDTNANAIERSFIEMDLCRISICGRFPQERLHSIVLIIAD
jgi:hypothetical protein